MALARSSEKEKSALEAKLQDSEAQMKFLQGIALMTGAATTEYKSTDIEMAKYSVAETIRTAGSKEVREYVADRLMGGFSHEEVIKGIEQVIKDSAPRLSLGHLAELTGADPKKLPDYLPAQTYWADVKDPNNPTEEEKVAASYAQSAIRLYQMRAGFQLKESYAQYMLKQEEALAQAEMDRHFKPKEEEAKKAA